MGQTYSAVYDTRKTSIHPGPQEEFDGASRERNVTRGVSMTAHPAQKL